MIDDDDDEEGPEARPYREDLEDEGDPELELELTIQRCERHLELAAKSARRIRLLLREL